MSAHELPAGIDRILATDKTLAGLPAWQPEPGGRVFRWVAGVLVNDELIGLTLTVKAYPTASESKFGIILAKERAIWRLDFAPDDSHTNSFNAPPGLAGIIISGHHYHAWQDNRRFCSSTTLPQRLQNARELPINIRTFENAYRWFCGETHIGGLDAVGIPILPKRTTLL